MTDKSLAATDDKVSREGIEQWFEMHGYPRYSHSAIRDLAIKGLAVSETGDKGAYEFGVKWGREMFQREARDAVLEEAALYVEEVSPLSSTPELIRALKGKPDAVCVVAPNNVEYAALISWMLAWHEPGDFRPPFDMTEWKRRARLALYGDGER